MRGTCLEFWERTPPKQRGQCLWRYSLGRVRSDVPSKGRFPFVEFRSSAWMSDVLVGLSLAPWGSTVCPDAVHGETSRAISIKPWMWPFVASQSIAYQRKAAVNWRCKDPCCMEIKQAPELWIYRTTHLPMELIALTTEKGLQCFWDGSHVGWHADEEFMGEC